MKQYAIITTLFLLLLATPSGAAGWEARLASHPNLPSTFLTVDKDSQTFFLYGQKSPIQLLDTYPCTTGQVAGDKFTEGDLRTPEGVYFIEGRLKRNLDEALYGNLAYSLNFPNPVDKLQGKTGYGIWLHGRGKKLVPRDTRGCIALVTADLRGMGPQLNVGMPVAITQKHILADGQPKTPGEMKQSIDALVKRVQAWALSWENKSDTFFDFYDTEKFPIAQGQSFNAFRGNKQRNFDHHPWIQVMAWDIRVMPGPDYWVTWFRQYYRTPTLTSEGIKRLYWQKDEDGQMRIVGREWIRTPRTLDETYLKLVRGQVGGVIEAWRTAWEQADMAGYLAHYAPMAAQGDRRGTASIQAHKTDLWQVSTPEALSLTDFDYSLAPQGVRITFRQDYKASSGYADSGSKTLLLSPTPDGWKIIREDWRPLS